MKSAEIARIQRIHIPGTHLNVALKGRDSCGGTPTPASDATSTEEPPAERMTGPRWSATVEGPRPSQKPVILVAMDGSHASILAADWAIEAGRSTEASVVLIHAVHLNLTSYGPANPRWLKDGLRHEAMDRAEPIMSRAQAAGVNVVFSVEEGVPATVITRAARRWQAQAIVMAAPQKGFWHRFFGDHTVEKVTRAAECPVIVLEGAHPEGFRGSSARSQKI